MTLMWKCVRVIWLFVALVLMYGLNAGGERAIAAFWILVVWTAPFGMLWRFTIYELMPEFIKTLLDSPIIGSVLVIICAYLFWFVFIPKIWSWCRYR